MHYSPMYEEQKPSFKIPGFVGYWGKLVAIALSVEEQYLKSAYSQNNISIPPIVFPMEMPLTLVRVASPVKRWASKDEQYLSKS
ncbi:MAG: hypothetical protein ACNS64_03850 [Candidatus Halalkalibacterium sp. M3_1C_030]